jgi:replicative DNA helicase
MGEKNKFVNVSKYFKDEFLTKFEKKQNLQKTDENYQICTGISTGFFNLDKILDGFHPGRLYILASRPSMGKTALSLNIASYLAFTLEQSIGYFSLEQNSQEIISKLIFSESEIEIDKFKNSSLGEQDLQKIKKVSERIEKVDFIVDDPYALTIEELCNRSRNMKKEYDVQIIFIDYIQLLTISRKSFNGDRYIEMSEISRMLKDLSKELCVPIVCLSQLSRKVEERAGHRPFMTDLRDSGSLEEDSDVVMFLFRRDYYNANDKPQFAEIIVAKNRHGGIGNVELFFKKKLGKFYNWEIFEQKEKNQYAAFSAFSPAH